MKVPYLLVVGPSDQQDQVVSIRARGIRQNLGTLSVDTFVEGVCSEISSKGKKTIISEHFQAVEV